MFVLVTGRVQHVPRQAAIPILVSTSIQGAALAAIVLTSLFYVKRDLPAVPDASPLVAEVPAAAPPATACAARRALRAAEPTRRRSTPCCTR